MLYQNFLGEFWCTVMVEDPKPPADNFKARPLKEFINKFTVINGKRPFTLDFKTLCESTGRNINPKDSERLKPLADWYLSTPLVTALLETDAEYQVDKSQSIRFELKDSDEEHKDTSDDDVFKSGEEMDEDIQEPDTNVFQKL
nr:hypothetical protein [Tanacetum cinerariifolium]